MLTFSVSLIYYSHNFFTSFLNSFLSLNDFTILLLEHTFYALFLMRTIEILISSNFITDMSGGTISFRKGTLMVPFLSFMENRKLFSIIFISLTLTKTKSPRL